MARFKPKQKKSQRKNHVDIKGLSALLNQALASHQQGDLHTAEQGYRTFLQHQPNHADTLQLLGVLTHQTGRLEEAAELISKAVKLQPAIPQYRFNLAVVLQELNRRGAAVEHYRHAVELNPNYPEAWDNLGVVLQDLGDFEDALTSHQKALAHNPESLLAHTNIGTLLNRLGHPEEALQHYEQAISIHPAHPEAHMKRAVALLHLGQISEGFKEYSWRRHTVDFQQANPVPMIPLPTWGGQPETGKTLLIYPEQGVGDEVMFASCLKDVAEHFQKVILACDPRLVRLWKRSFPDLDIVSADLLNSPDSLDRLIRPVDYKVALGDLPRHSRQAMGDFGAGNAFLVPDLSLTGQWKGKLATLPGKINIGISWRGGRDERTREARSLPIQAWKPLFDLPDINLINLQYGDCRADLQHMAELSDNQPIDLPGHNPLEDLEGFSALIASLDLVVSVDNSTIHFAGALGVPTLALLPCPPDWRWFGQNKNTPWYRSLECLHQQTPDDESWQKVMTAVVKRVQDQSYPAQKDIKPSTDSTIDTQVDLKEPIRNPPEKLALLLNDTSHWYHWGCSCTSLAIHQQLRDSGWVVNSVSAGETAQLQNLPATPDEFDSTAVADEFRRANPELVAKIESADLILVNGEGTLHGANLAAIGLLYLARLASARFQKPVQIINHSCYPDPAGCLATSQLNDLYKKVYDDLDFIAIREPVSAQYLSDLDIQIERSFDCLPLFCSRQGITAEASEDRIVVAGSVAWNPDMLQSLYPLFELAEKEGLQVDALTGASAHMAADDVAFVEALQKHASNRFRLVNATSEKAWLETIGTARLLVSGRFHHSIAAAWLKTPFLVLDSNTAKVDGLMSELKLDLHLPHSTPHLGSVLTERSSELLQNPAPAQINSSTRSRLLELSRSNFSHLPIFS